MNILQRIKNELDTEEHFSRYPHTDHSYIGSVSIGLNPDRHYQITVYAGGIGAAYDALRIELVGVDELFGETSKQKIDTVILSRERAGLISIEADKTEQLPSGLVHLQGKTTGVPYQGMIIGPGHDQHILFEELYSQLKGLENTALSSFPKRVRGEIATGIAHFSYQPKPGITVLDNANNLAIVTRGAFFSLMNSHGEGMQAFLDATTVIPFSVPADLKNSPPIRFQSGIISPVSNYETLERIRSELMLSELSPFQSLQRKIEALYKG